MIWRKKRGSMYALDVTVGAVVLSNYRNSVQCRSVAVNRRFSHEGDKARYEVLALDDLLWLRTIPS
ncbi:hypothetical protein [Nitrospira sp. Nam74]